MSADHDDLREKIDEAKRRLPLPQLLGKLGLTAHAKKSARCPFPGHDDKHSSFSIFQGKGGFWFWKCHAGCGEGDEILFLSELKGLSLTDAMSLYLGMAGFPPHSHHKSREYPPVSSVSRFPKSLVCPVSLVSNGQGLDGEVEKQLRELTARHAYTSKADKAVKRRFKLARYVTAFQLKLGRKLEIAELRQALNEWHRLSQRFLDPVETCDDHWVSFLAELTKVRKPPGEHIPTTALENVAKLSVDQLLVIPGWANAPEECRRLATLHREMDRLSPTGTYFLDYRNAAKVYDGLTPPKAHKITGALVTLGVIDFVSKGKVGLNSGKAAEFRFLLSQTENGASETEDSDPF
jgi:hypothetical protein